MPEWEQLPNQVGSTKLTVPEVELKIQGTLKKAYTIGYCVVSFVALLWHFAIPSRLTGGSHLAFFLAIIANGLSVGWIVREISWTQHKYDADQFVNMCISFHVDLYCIFILFMIFCFFTISQSCSDPIKCLPTCLGICAVQANRCFMFTCGMTPNRANDPRQEGEEAQAAAAQSSKGASQHVEKEVETEEAYKRRKMINAGCAFGILALGGLSFFVPQLSFAVALGICVGLPFFRAMQNKTEDHSNV